MFSAEIPAQVLDRKRGPKPKLALRREELIELLSRPGMTYRDIAEKLGCGVRTVEAEVALIKKEEREKRDAPRIDGESGPLGASPDQAGAAPTEDTALTA